MGVKMKRVLTYGTFDLLHYDHIRLLERAKQLGNYLIVALSTDEFNEIKGKKTYHNYETRKKMLEVLDMLTQLYQKKNGNKKYKM